MTKTNVRPTLKRTVLRILTWLAVISLPLAVSCACVAAEAQTAGSDDAWVASMKAVHEKFRGERGTYAQFGDSITVSRAFWFGLKHARNNASPEMERAFGLVKGYMLDDCWDRRGPQYGNQGQMTIRWAHENVDQWLKKLNPEVALMMFGSNDLGSLELPEYETKTREVVQKCLDNGTILILSTIPPKHGQAEKAAAFAGAVRKIAREMKVPLTDYHAEILSRRPNDWDGAASRFSQYQGYDVPTLISRDGVHPSNPQKYVNDYSAEGLRSSGFGLRSYLALMKYAEVIEKALPGKPAPKDAPRRTITRIPVIIDTDIGTDIDDALALGLALSSPELDLRGVTTVSDDAFTRAMIACRFLEAVGRADVPVAAGRALRETPAIAGQYQYGLRPGRKRPEKETAVEFLYRQLKSRPGEITLITIGDLTNVAELLMRHPESKPWIKRLVLMGGSVRVGYGNKAQPDREWNLRSDVKAARIVFTSGVRLVVAPLDATVQVRLTAPLRQRIFARETALGWHLRALYELWGKETPVLFDPVAVTLALDESFCKMEDLRIEVDREGFTREIPGPPNCRVAMAIRADAYLEWYVRRIVEWPQGSGSGGPALQPPGEMRPVNPVRPAARGGLPRRIHVAEDYETDIERRWWLAGRLAADEVPPGIARACRGVLCRDFDDQMGNRDAIYRAVVFNPVPGPPMGRNTRLSFRYRLVGTDVLRVQIYSLTNGYHRCLSLTGLAQNEWRAATVDMTQARRPDGSGGPLSEDERIDDVQFYVDRRAEVMIDDVVLFDAAAADEKRPFPQRIHFTGWFDTGKQGREWPGDFEIVPHDKPLGWFAARSVPRPQADAPWLRVALRGPRPLGERTCLRFRYRLAKGNDFRVVLADTKTNEQVEVAPESFVVRQWAEAVVEFPRNAARRLRHADEIRFLLQPGAELLVDDLLLYEPGLAVSITSSVSPRAIAGLPR